MDDLTGLLGFLAAMFLFASVMSPRTGVVLDYFAAGFLGYRSYGWPRGVQEEEPVSWSWTSPRRGSDDAVEVIDIDPDDAPAAGFVDRRIGPGSARRPN